MKFKIGERELGPDSPALIMAELSCNHNHNFDLAVKTIEAMKVAGADVVKVQTYTPDTITLDCDNEYFQIKQGTLWDGTTLYKLYQEAYTPWDWMPKLQHITHQLGMEFISSPFDISAVELLEEMNVPAYKVASFEIQDIPLITAMAKTGKPIIISTGIATKQDIELAIKTCHRQGNRSIVLLKCTSAYPTPLDEVNLATMVDMATQFKKMVGLSDHTEGSLVPIMATALGGKVIEKHFILDRSLGGPDAPFSMEPAEFKAMVDQVRQTELALGKVTYALSSKVKKAREFGRSIFVVKDIEKGEPFTAQNIRSIRPGFGLHPQYYHQIIGKKARSAIKYGTPLTWHHITK